MSVRAPDLTEGRTVVDGGGLGDEADAGGILGDLGDTEPRGGVATGLLVGGGPDGEGEEHPEADHLQHRARASQLVRGFGSGRRDTVASNVLSTGERVGVMNCGVEAYRGEVVEGSGETLGLAGDLINAVNNQMVRTWSGIRACEQDLVVSGVNTVRKLTRARSG